MNIDEYLKLLDDIDAYLTNCKDEPTTYDELHDNQKEIVDSCVNEILGKARLIEPEITEVLLSLQEEGVSNLVSLNHRIKEKDSLRRKIIADSKASSSNYSLAALKISDSVRYTFVIQDDDLYVSKVDEYLTFLESLGYRVLEFKNSWGSKYYQGFNVKLATSADNVFEIQFHTEMGYEIKKHTRNLYNIIRDENAPTDLQKSANIFRKMLQKPIHIPVNAEEYEFKSNIKWR